MADAVRAGLAAALRQRSAVVLHAFPSAMLLEEIQRLVAEATRSGQNVALLFDGPRAHTKDQTADTWGPLLRPALLADRFHEGNAFLGTVSSFMEVIRNRGHVAWLERLGLLLIPRAEDIFRRPFAWELMALALRDRFHTRPAARMPRTVAVVEPRRGPESAIRDALPIYSTTADAERTAWHEHRVHHAPPQDTWWTLWSSESMRDYAARLLENSPPSFCGATGPLAQFAGRWGVPHDANWILVGPGSGDRDHHQNLQQGVGTLGFSSRPASGWSWLSAAATLTGAVTMTDAEGSPWRSLHRAVAAFGGLVLCNVVCRIDMLLEYQAANPQWFSAHPLQSLSPLTSATVAFDSAVQLIQRVDAAGALPASIVHDVVTMLHIPAGTDDQDVSDVFAAARDLVESQLGEHLASQLRWVDAGDWEASTSGGETLRRGCLALDGGLLGRAPIDWLDEFEVAVSAGGTFDVVRREHVSQLYWPGKTVLLDEQKFRVEEVNGETRRVVISHDDQLELPDYRLERRLSLATAEPAAKEVPEDLTAFSGARLLVEPMACAFSVTDTGVVSSYDHWSSPPSRLGFREPIMRTYAAGRAVRIRMLDPTGRSLLAPGAAVALAAWINEAARTILPEVHAFLIAAPQVSPEARPKLMRASIVPDLRVEAGGSDDVAIWVFEDSLSNLGIVRALVRDIRYVLDLCFDWLEWTIDEAAAPREDPPCLLEGKRRDWFAFGMSQPDPAFDLASLRSTLAEFRGEFRVVTPHRRASSVETMLKAGHLAGDVHCDICGTQVEAGLPHDVLGDGRISCHACTAVGVAQLTALERMFHTHAVPFFNEAHRIVDIANVSVRLVDQAEISQALGRRFISTSGFDMRAIGLAMAGSGRSRSGTQDQGERHLVMIESGFSPEATAVTLVHELCHVWQYNHLDVTRLDAESRSLWLEGHAVWVEGSFLEWLRARAGGGFNAATLAQSATAWQALTQSESVYGEGYRMIAARLRRSTRPAFDLLRGLFPRN